MFNVVIILIRIYNFIYNFKRFGLPFFGPVTILKEITAEMHYTQHLKFMYLTEKSHVFVSSKRQIIKIKLRCGGLIFFI